jgi:hypothetical protein
VKADRSADPSVAPAAGSAARSQQTEPARGGLAWAGVAAGAVAVAFVADPATIEDGPVICPFRLLTGLPCPGCGLTRSWVYLAHGQWADAWSANPFGVVTMVLAVAYVVAVGWSLLARRGRPDVGRVLRSKPFLALGVVWVGFGIIRAVAVAG